MKLFKASLMLLLAVAFTACDTAINPGDLAGDWENGVETYVNGDGEKTDMDVAYTFFPNENDSTYGDFYVQLSARHDETLDDGVKISVGFQVIEKGKYSLADNELTLTYYPDSLGCRVNPDDIKDMVAKTNPKATDEDIEEEINLFTNFIGESFEESFKKTKTETIYITLTPTELSYQTTDDRTVKFNKVASKNAKEEKE